MSTDLSKLCADFLRQNHVSQSTEKLKASHARELVAAFFGYKSHAALMAEKTYPLVQLEEAYIFIPDIPLMNDRRSKLNGLPNDLTQSIDLASFYQTCLPVKGYVVEMSGSMTHWKTILSKSYYPIANLL